MQPPIPVGTVLQNRYRIINILGQGGFGRTYLAEDQRRFNEPCAIKELIPAITGTNSSLQKAEELFQREAVTLYQIEHPQVPQFRERFEQDQRLFLVQEYVAGKTYRALLEERKARGSVFTEIEVSQLMRSLLLVLEYLHGRGIIHRDISPENIICRESDGKPVLIDFGVVKELATKLQSLNTTEQLTSVGKLGYAPSEQMQTGRAYPNSDLFALAVTAIVLLTGREPQDLYDEHQAAWNWQRFARVNPRFAQILNRMLNFIPSDRFQTASDVIQALQLVDRPNVSNPINPNLSNVQTIAVGRRPDPIPQRATPNRPDPIIPTPSNRSVLDSPLAVGAIGAAVVVLAGFGSWALVSSIRNQPRGEQPAETTPQSFPSPVITEGSTLTPTPISTPTTTSDPVVYSKRLIFGGSNIANVRGRLRANETIQFTFQGDEGQQLTTSLAQQGEVLLTVLAPNREPIDGIAREVASYQGVLPFTGKYIIQLSPVPGITESDYNLTVGLEKPAIPTPTQPILEQTPTPTPSETPNQPSIEVPTDTFPTPTPTVSPTDQFPQQLPSEQLPSSTGDGNNVSPSATPTPTFLQTP